MSRHRIALSLLISVLFLGSMLWLKRWEKTLYHGDSSHYYLHVVSFFVNGDVGDYDKTITSLRKTNPGSDDPREDKFGIRLTERGRRYIKYTLGVPVMEAPFFLLAHAFVNITGCCAADGWSRPYLFFVSLSTLFYLGFGFYLLSGVLERYFSRRVVWVTCLTLALATNLYYHATYVTMAHAFLFFDYCLLLWLSIRFYERPGAWGALGIGMVVGLIGITRVPEVISVLIPLLWGVNGFAALRERIQFYLRHYGWALVMLAGFLAVFSIQFAYWYYVSGKLYFNPYEGEGFNFSNPKIHKGWFDFSNGWLIYTPVMALALIGLWRLPRYVPGALLPVCVFVGLHSYIHYSYYAWTFFPGLGQRPMVETYPLLALGLATFVAGWSKGGIGAWLLGAGLLAFGWLNIFQTWQMKEGIIWSERHNKAFYIETFGATHWSEQALRAYDSNQIQPDSAQLGPGVTLLELNFNEPGFDTLSVDTLGKRHVLILPRDFLTIAEGLPFDFAQTEYIGISVDLYTPAQSSVPHRHMATDLVVEFDFPDGRKIKSSSIKPSTHVGNPECSIWTPGGVDTWGTAGYFAKVPERAAKGATLKVFAYNHAGQTLLFDRLTLTAYGRR